MITNIQPDLPQLSVELTAAGVPFNALGSYGIGDGQYNVHTYSPKGEIIELPAGARAVLSAHVPPPPRAVPNFGADSAHEADIADAVTNLRAYIALGTPNNAQTVAVVKLLCRCVLFLAKRSLHLG